MDGHDQGWVHWEAGGGCLTLSCHAHSPPRSSAKAVRLSQKVSTGTNSNVFSCIINSFGGIIFIRTAVGRIIPYSGLTGKLHNRSVPTRLQVSSGISRVQQVWITALGASSNGCLHLKEWGEAARLQSSCCCNSSSGRTQKWYNYVTWHHGVASLPRVLGTVGMPLAGKRLCLETWSSAASPELYREY